VSACVGRAQPAGLCKNGRTVRAKTLVSPRNYVFDVGTYGRHLAIERFVLGGDGGCYYLQYRPTI